MTQRLSVPWKQAHSAKITLYGTHQKDGIDRVMEANIRLMDDHITFALDGDKSHSNEKELDSGDNDHQHNSEEIECNDKEQCDYEGGPESRIDYDEYYEARKDKVMKPMRPPKGAY